MHGGLLCVAFHLSVCPYVCDQKIIHWTKNHQIKINIKYQGQRLHWSKSNKDPKERQVGSQQRQVASFNMRQRNSMPQPSLTRISFFCLPLNFPNASQVAPHSLHNKLGRVYDWDGFAEMSLDQHGFGGFIIIHLPEHQYQVGLEILMFTQIVIQGTVYILCEVIIKMHRLKESAHAIKILVI